MVHSVDILEEAIELAKQIGFQVRHEWLDGSSGGTCRIGSSWVLFVDLSLTASEQMDQAISALMHPEFRTALAKLGPGSLSQPLLDLLDE